MEFYAYTTKAVRKNGKGSLRSVQVIPLAIGSAQQFGSVMRETAIKIGNDNILVYAPARPRDAPTLRQRIRRAWDVFCGRADVLYWPGQE